MINRRIRKDKRNQNLVHKGQSGLQVFRRLITSTLVLLCLGFSAPSFAVYSCPMTVVQGAQQTAAPGAAFNLDLVVESIDPTPSQSTPQSVFWTIISSNATFLQSGTDTYGHSVAPQFNGVSQAVVTASARVIAGNATGTVLVEVISEFCSLPTTFVLNIGQPPPLEIPVDIEIMQGDQQSGAVGALLPTALSVRVSKSGTAVAAAPVIFEVTAGDAQIVQPSGINNPVLTDNSGRASITVRMGSSPGPVTVRAYSTITPIINAAFFRLQTVVNAVVGLPVSGNNQIGTTGFAGEPLVARFSNNNGSALPSGGQVAWRVLTGSCASLGTTSSVTDASGLTQIPISFSLTPCASTIEASRVGGGIAIFSVSSENPQLRLASGSMPSGGTGVLIFELLGGGNRGLAGQTVGFSVASGSVVLTPSSATTDAAGRATVNYSLSTPGATASIRASALNNRVSTETSVQAGSTLLQLDTGNNQQTVVGNQLANALSIRLTQAGGTGVVGQLVNWAVVSGLATLNSATSITNAAGVATNNLISNVAGTVQVSATIANAGTVIFTITVVTIDTTSQFAIVSGNNQTLATNASSQPLIVRVTNASGQPLAGRVVNWRGVPASDLEVTPARSVTDSDGRAQATARPLIPGMRSVEAALENSNAAVLVFAINAGVANVPGLSRGQQNIARAIDTACPALAGMPAASRSPGQSDLLARCSELVGNAGNNSAAVANALSEMLADESEAQRTAAFANVQSQFDNVKARLAALRSPTSQISLSGLSLNTPNGSLPLSFLPSVLAANTESEVGGGFDRWGFFINGTISRGSYSANAISQGFEFDTIGLTSGVDYRVSNRLVVGAALGFNKNDTQIDLNKGDMDTSGTTLSAYLSYYPNDNWYADAVLSYGQTGYDLKRRILYQVSGAGTTATTQVNQTMFAKPDGTQKSATISIGRDWYKGAWNFGPYLRTSYSKLDIDAYSEQASLPQSAGSGLGMTIESQSVNALAATLGAKASYTKSTNWGILIPQMTLEFNHEFEDQNDPVLMRFTNDPTRTLIAFDGSSIDKSSLNVGFGVSAIMSGGRSGYIYYERLVGKDRVNQDSLAIGIRIEF